MVDIDNPAYVPADHEVVVDATNAVQQGDPARLDALIGEFPWLPTVRKFSEGGQLWGDSPERDQRAAEFIKE